MPIGAHKLGMQQFNTLVTYVSGAVEFDSSNNEGLSVVCNNAQYDYNVSSVKPPDGMSVWIKPATITSGTIFEYGFSDSEAGGLDHYPIFRLRLANTGALIFEGSDDNYQTNHTAQDLYKFTTDNNVITANEWNHIVFSIDWGTTGFNPAIVKMFVNGQRITPTVNSDPKTSQANFDGLGWLGDVAGNDPNFDNFRISVGCQSRASESPYFTDHYNGQITQLWVGYMPDLVQSHQIAVGGDSTSHSTTEAGLRLFYDGGIVDVGENGQLPQRIFDTNPAVGGGTNHTIRGAKPEGFREMTPARFFFSGDLTTFVKNRANRTATITDISKANPAVVTVSAGHLMDQDITTDITVQDVNGFDQATTPESNFLDGNFRAEWQSATTLFLLGDAQSSSDQHIDSNYRYKNDITPTPAYVSGKEDYVSGGTIIFQKPGANCNDLSSTSLGINAPSSVTGILNLPNKYIT